MTPVLLFILGLIILSWGADRFVSGARVIAYRSGIPPAIIGMLLVGFATSVPEMLVAGIAAFDHKSMLAVGNVIGSNIANIGMVLGIAGLIRPLVFPSALLHHEYPLLVIVSIFVLLMLVDGNLSRIDGYLLMIAFILFTSWMIFKLTCLISAKEKQAIKAVITEADMPLKKAIFWWCVGLVSLLVGAQLTVDNSVQIARMLGISEVVIGLTLVAIGTSVPELAASIAAVRKNEPGMVIGNVIGSNLFNIMPVLMVPALIHPVSIPHDVLYRDVAVMMLLTVLLGVFCLTSKREVHFGRIKSFILLLIFVSYITFLFYSM